jgi:O-antigen/teichoic acid export membrane protein
MQVLARSRKTTIHLAAVALPLAGVVTWLAPELVGLFGSQYSEAATALRVLIWASVCL